jgi:ribosome-binding factor A
MTKRQERVNELLREELSNLLRTELNDPRLGRGLVTITEVQVSPDFRHATVYVSFLGDEEAQPDALRALQGAAPYLHRTLVPRLDLRNVPELHFRFDPTIERGARLAALINQVQHERGAAGEP